MDILLEWRAVMPVSAWRRLWKGMRILKELNEGAPVAINVLRWVEAMPDGADVEVVDICSGIGFLSMLLSHLLPREKVRGIWLVDKQWPHANRSPLPHEISKEHICAVSWPIPLATRKTDIKDGSDVRNLSACVFGRARGPVIMAGVHLCGTLSIKCVQIFNNHPQCVGLVLKPCCLPGKKHIFTQQRLALRTHTGNTAQPNWRLGKHTFTAAELYGDDGVDNVPTTTSGDGASPAEPAKSAASPPVVVAELPHGGAGPWWLRGRNPNPGYASKLTAWTGHLLMGIDMEDEATPRSDAGQAEAKRIERILIAPWTPQNLFLIAERSVALATSDAGPAGVCEQCADALDAGPPPPTPMLAAIASPAATVGT